MTDRRIVGVCLVKNEENFVGWALSNAAEFCDEILVMDNGSLDRTRAVLDIMTARHKHIRVISVDDANKTHTYIEHLAGSDTWVFGIDGDEIYDQVGLARLRARLLSGEFDSYWRIFGHTIHTRELDLGAHIARGYAAPIAASVTKLYNFSGISSWHQPDHERLHGKDMAFRPGYSWDHAYSFWQHEGWNSSDCRCLHMCFAPRSSLDDHGNPRANPIDVKKAQRIVKRLTKDVVRLLDPDYDIKKNYKYKHYAVGDVVTEYISGFGRPLEMSDFLPLGAELDSMLADQIWLPESFRRHRA